MKRSLSLRTFAILMALFCHSFAEDLRLAPDGKSLEAVATITNTVTRETLAKIEQDTMGDIAQAKQVIAVGEAKLLDIRRYMTTLDAMLKMKATGTNVVHVPITIPTNAPLLSATNPPPSTNSTSQKK